MSQFLIELHPRRENNPVLTVPLNITRAKQLENEPKSNKWNAFTEELKATKDTDIFRLFTPDPPVVQLDRKGQILLAKRE